MDHAAIAWYRLVKWCNQSINGWRPRDRRVMALTAFCRQDRRTWRVWASSSYEQWTVHKSNEQELKRQMEAHRVRIVHTGRAGRGQSNRRGRYSMPGVSLETRGTFASSCLSAGCLCDARHGTDVANVSVVAKAQSQDYSCISTMRLWGIEGAGWTRGLTGEAQEA